MTQPKPFTYVWEQDELTIHLTKLRESRDGDLKAEMEITTTRKYDQAGKEYQEVIYDAKFNLSSNRARLQFAKEMLPIYVAEWEQIISEVCQRAKKEFREGEPAIILSKSDKSEPPKYLLKPFLLENKPTIMYGDSGIGKSNFALLLSLSVSLPWHDNPLGFEVNEHRSPVLYLDYEADEDDIQWNINRLIAGLDLIDAPVVYRPCIFPLIDDVEEVKNWIARHNIRLVVIDSIFMACGGELNKTDSTYRFNLAVRQLKTTTLILAHTSKQEDKTKTIYGNAFFKAIARSVWEVKQAQETDKDIIDLAFFDRKANLARRSSPLGFRLSFTDDEIVVKKQDIADVAEFRAALSTQAQILMLLKGGLMSVSDLIDDIGATDNTIRQALSRLHRARKIIKVEDDWGLAAYGV